MMIHHYLCPLDQNKQSRQGFESHFIYLHHCARPHGGLPTSPLLTSTFFETFDLSPMGLSLAMMSGSSHNLLYNEQGYHGIYSPPRRLVIVTPWLILSGKLQLLC